MSKEFYSLQPLAVEVHPVSTGTDIILRRSFEACTIAPSGEEGEPIETISCDEVQYRYRGEITADEVAAKFDYWWDIAVGKTVDEAEENEAVRNGEPTLTERVDTLENAFMEFVEVMLNG